jgi:UDP-N-acetylmuramoyl-tripeptide--D-alanyl-D-alanine ligase
VIAITGTNGKTTTKELIHAVLSKKYNVKSTIGNFNNHIGVPLTILSISENHEFAVVEMGANHIGEIKFLCEIAKPNFGIITNVGKAHLEGFGSFEGVKKAKQELYSYIRGIKGKVFINYDNDVLTKLMLNQEKVTFGTRQKYFCFGETIYSNPFLKISWNQQNVAKSIQTNLIGEYNFENVMSAICIADYFGVAENDIVHAIENYFPTNNRSQYIETDNNTIILDAYNANPTSMAAAIINFNKINFANKTLIIGDMLELGKSSSIEHSKIIDLVKSFTFSKIYLVGKKFYEQKIPDNFNRFLNVEELISFIKQAPLSSSLILIKASRGIKLELIKDIL